MGIRGLLTYMENYCKKACYAVSIEDLAKKYKAETGNDPVIVVDMQSFYCTWSEGLDSIIGLDVQELFHRIREFVRSFEKIGIKLVFFSDGVIVEKKRKEWLHRQRVILQKVFGVLDILSEGTPTQSISENFNKPPPVVGVFAQLFLKYVLNYELYITVEECDEEILEYVHKNPCMAIFTQDSDFIVSDIRQCKVLSSQKFDQDSMAALMYDGEELARSLRIRTDRLPLFGILLGNYTIDQEILTHFHRSICRGRFSKSGNISYKVLMPAVAQYISKLPDRPIDEILELICVKIFGDKQSLDSIKCSYRSYLFQETSVTPNPTPTTTWSQILQVAEHRHRNFIMHTIIWGVLKNQVFLIHTSFEDVRKAVSGDLKNADSIIPSVTVTRLLRQRIYGILLFEHDHFDDLEVTEWCCENADSYNEPVLVKPVVPIVLHPGLLQLWNNDDNAELNEVKWKLFLSCISPNITTTSVEKWRALPDDLVSISATLFYLLEQEFMDEDEMNAVIATVATNSLYSRQNEINGRYNLRRTHISIVITRTFSMVIALMGACGYPVPISEKLIHMKFEAKQFQIKYEMMKQKKTIEELCENNDQCIGIFEQLKGVLRRAVDDDFERLCTSRDVQSECNLEAQFSVMRTS